MVTLKLVNSRSTKIVHKTILLIRYKKQDQKLTNIEKYSNRGSFDAADFVAAASLGKAVAANFYEARHEAL